jgi:hypothetical protein
MKRLFAWAVGAALCVGAGTASAAPIEQGVLGGFSIDSFRTAGSGSLAGFDIIRFVAINNGKGETLGSTKLQSINITMSVPNNNLKLDFRDLDGDGAADANILGSGINPNAPIGSYIRVGALPTFNAVNVLPQGGNSDPDGAVLRASSRRSTRRSRRGRV